MIKLTLIEGLFCPIVECDRCGDPITNIGMGAVVWDWNEDHTATSPLEYRHKGPCFPMSERRPWRELREFLDQLRANAESHPGPAIRDARS